MTTMLLALCDLVGAVMLLAVALAFCAVSLARGVGNPNARSIGPEGEEDGD